MRPIRLGVIGLGRAFMLMRPTFVLDERVALTAAADPRPAARARFAQQHGPAFDSVEALCVHSGLDAVYVASPHQHHLAHVRAAAAAGLHVLVEKPMALSLEECQAMIDATDAAGVALIVGHSHGFDRPYARARAMIETGRFGAVRMVHAANHTDWLDRPRRPEELDTAQGGGVLVSQAPHQVDLVRLLVGSPARTVRAHATGWGRAARTESAYSALIGFACGAFASLTYGGHGRFDSDECMGWMGEMGHPRDPADYGAARARLEGVSPEAEAALKDARTFGADEAPLPSTPAAYNHFGPVLVSCEHADLRPMPGGVMIYGEERRFEALPAPDVARAEVIDALWAAVREGQPPLQSGAWGMQTMAVCLAMQESARSGREIALP